MRISDWSSDVCSSDLLTVQKRGLGRYDDGGALAASGEINQTVLSHLLAHPYFEREGPKSLDRYDFPLVIVNDLSAADAAATLEIGRASCRDSGCQYA